MGTGVRTEKATEREWSCTLKLKVTGREILVQRKSDSRSRSCYLLDGTVSRGTAPSGASTSEFELWNSVMR